MKSLKTKFRTWVQNKLGITKLHEEISSLQRELNYHRNFVIDKVAELKKYTVVDADIGERGNNTIILTGVYRNKAFVRFYDIGDGEFIQLINQMKYMREHCLIRNIDKPPNFHGVFDI